MTRGEDLIRHDKQHSLSLPSAASSLKREPLAKWIVQKKRFF